MSSSSTVSRSFAGAPSHRTLLALAAASLGLAACAPLHAAATTWTDGVTAVPSTFNLNNNTIPLNLRSDTDATFTSDVTVNANTVGGVIDVDPTTAATGKTITLAGTFNLSSENHDVAVTSSNGYRLILTSVVGNGTWGGATLVPTSANVSVTSANNLALGGTTLGNTVGAITGGLTKRGSGTWTVTGNNSAGTWQTTIQAGNLVVAPGAALGTGGIEVQAGSTLTSQSGTSIASGGGWLFMRPNTTLSLADGAIGTFTDHQPFYTNGGATLVLDASDQGVDQFSFDSFGNGAGGNVQLSINALTANLKNGVYTIVSTSATNLNVLHFGFTDSLLSTATLNGYTLTLAAGASAETLTVSGGPSVPEPASALLLTGGLLALTRRASRKIVR